MAKLGRPRGEEKRKITVAVPLPTYAAIEKKAVEHDWSMGKTLVKLAETGLKKSRA